MRSQTHHRHTIILSLALLSLPLGTAAQPSSSAASGSVPAGGMRSEVTLDLRTAAVVPTPALQADAPAHRALLTMTAGAGVVRVGQFHADASIHIDTVEIAVDEPEMVGDEASLATHDLWLGSTTDGWTLQVASAQAGAVTQPSDVLGTVLLAHTTAATSAATLAAGIVPAGADGGRLVLRWGSHEWTTDVRFSAPRDLAPRPRESGKGNDRPFEFDSTDDQRSSRLATRDMATVTLPDGVRLGVVYPKGLAVEDRDFAHLVSVAPDAVVRVGAGAVIRLDHNVPLRFGAVTLGTGNVGLTGSPGAYGLWLKRTATGWRLVFNDEPDAWGTQHDPAFDTAEVDLVYTQADDSSRALSASVVMTATDQGRFTLVWGPHEWTTGFALAR